MKVTVLNTQERNLVLNTVVDGNVQSVTIPWAKQDPEKQGEKINGSALVESEFLDAAKKSPVVQQYFKEGWLREGKKAA